MSGGLPSEPDLRDLLLDLLRHEDDQLLWEVVWSMSTNAPDAPISTKVDLARSVVLGLVDAGAVELVRIDWPSREGRPLTPEEARRLTREDRPWCDPEATDLLVEIRLTDAA